MILDGVFNILGARRDARAGLDSADDRVVAENGPRPEFDAVGNAEHARLLAALDRVPIDELREDLVRAEDATEAHTSPKLLTLGLLAAVAVETVGAMLVVKSLGLPATERLPLGIALATAVIGITAATAHRSPARTSSEMQKTATKAKRSLATALVYVVYAAFVGALTVVRLRSAGAEDSSAIETLAESLLMLATSLGPAWLAEWLMRRRAPAVAAWRRVESLRRRLRDRERVHARAQAAVDRIARSGQRWDEVAERRRAAYRTHHRLEQARVEGEERAEVERTRMNQPMSIEKRRSNR